VPRSAARRNPAPLCNEALAAESSLPPPQKKKKSEQRNYSVFSFFLKIKLINFLINEHALLGAAGAVAQTRYRGRGAGGLLGDPGGGGAAEVQRGASPAPFSHVLALFIFLFFLFAFRSLQNRGRVSLSTVPPPPLILSGFQFGLGVCLGFVWGFLIGFFFP